MCKVHFQVIEGTRRRMQVFEGVVIKRQGHGARETFTVRKQSFGVGVERMFPLHSPKIERIEVAARGDVRRAKLYYLRDRVGKRARVRERRYAGPEEVVEPGLLHEPAEATDAEGMTAEETRRRGRAGRDGGAEARTPARTRRQRPRRRGGAEAEQRRRRAGASRDGRARGGRRRRSREHAATAESGRAADSAPPMPAMPEGGEVAGDTAGVSPGAKPGAKRAKSTTNSLVEFVLIVLVALGLALGIQAWIVKPYRIPSGSMEPTLAIGQRVLVDRIGTHFCKPHVGRHRRLPSARRRTAAACADPIAAHRQTGRRRLRRTDPEGGHEHQLHQAHRRRPGRRDLDPRRPRDPQRQAPSRTPTSASATGSAECNFPIPIRIPAGHWFMMGDNRGESDDSRFWGPVPTSWIIGEAFATYWPPDRIGFF